MSDRPPMPNGDGGLDADLERRLRAAFAEAAVPEAPAAVHAEAARLAAAPDVRVRHRLGRWPAPGWIAVVLALSAIVVGSLFTGGSSPAPTEPSVPPAPTDSSMPEQSPSPDLDASTPCEVSGGAVHGIWWREIGGPGAWFNWDTGRQPAGRTWPLIVRFAPAPASPVGLSVWADRLGSGEQIRGTFDRLVDRSTLRRFSQQAPEMPGSRYRFEQPIPSPGCWRLSAAVDGQVVGTATIEIAPVRSPSDDPTSSPTATPEPTPWPVESMAPAADDVLPLAGRDGLPGTLECGGMPFGFDALAAPTGAEDRVGLEYDVLRSTSGGDPDPGGDLGPNPTWREVARSENAVLFLYEQPPDSLNQGYLYIVVERDGIDWRWAGSGDCTPRAVAPPGYGLATWTLDQAGRPSGRERRQLDILVQELACTSGRSASGRISPAFVTWDEREIVIEVFVETIPGGGDCQGVPPTPATLHLPVPVEGRTLVDPVALGLGGTGG